MEDHEQGLPGFYSDQDFKAQASACARRFFPRKGGKGVEPVALVAHMTPKGRGAEVFPLDHPRFNDYGTRAGLLAQVGRDLADTGRLLLAAFMVSEAWVSNPQNGTYKPGMAPSEDPGRQEAAVMAGRTLDGRRVMAFSILARRGDGRVASVGPPELTFFPANAEGDRAETATLDGLFRAYVQAMQGRIKARGLWPGGEGGGPDA